MKRAITLPAPLAEIPWAMLLPLCALVLFGAAVLYSAAGGSMSPYASSHLVRFGVFAIMALVMWRLPRDWVFPLVYPGYVVVLLLLLGVDILGQVKGGSQRWLEVGPVRLQPSELMKPTVVLVLASYFHTLPVGLIATWRALVPPALIMAFPMALVLLQPDLGTTLAIAFGGAVVIFLAGPPIRWFFSGGVAAMVVAPLAYFFGIQDYQRHRVDTFLDPESDPQGSGYHIIQSKIAIGSGGIPGKGFGEGSQSHLDYLPEPHTDFVFATMAEEWGLIGGIFVLLVFGIILRWGLNVARAAPDRFSRLLAGGLTATMFFYVAVNLMMVMGLAPVVGIPLPFMSHGGSSMMTNMICIGGLLMVDRWTRQSGPLSS